MHSFPDKALKNRCCQMVIIEKNVEGIVGREENQHAVAVILIQNLPELLLLLWMCGMDFLFRVVFLKIGFGLD